MWDIFLLIVGAILGVIATRIDSSIRRKIIAKRNEDSKKNLPYYNPLNDDIILLRQWNSQDVLDETTSEIFFNEKRQYDLLSPTIACPYISAPKDWESIYANELKKEKKRTGIVSYVTSLSLDHKDTKEGNKLKMEVSSCDYLAHHVNSKYFTKYPQDWEGIKQVIYNGELDAYFKYAMPGNVFVNFVIINGQTNNVLAIKRSSQELNARNIWGLGGFETMNNIANVANGSEELKLSGIIYRGIGEELIAGREEISKIAICSLSFVRHLGIMVTALVRVDLEGVKDDKKKGSGTALTEGEFIQRVLSRSKSGYEHSSLRWIPINLKEMKHYIEDESGFYKEILETYDGKGAKWITYVKLQMYQIWCNHDSIGITL